MGFVACFSVLRRRGNRGRNPLVAANELGLPWILGAYAVGIGCASFLEIHPFQRAFPLLAGLLWLICRRRPFAPSLLLLFFWMLGSLFYHLSIAPPQDPIHIQAFIGERPLIVEGSVLSVSSRTLNRSIIEMESLRAGSEGILAPVRGKVRVYVDEESPARPGQVIRFRARLRAPREFGIPGEFDYPRHLAGKGIFAIASLDHAHEIVTFGAPAGDGRFELFAGWRFDLARFIDTNVPSSGASLVKAMVIGETGGITPQQRELMARGGVSHIFAISGQHLSMIAIFLYAILLLLYRRSERLLLLAPPRRVLPLAIVPLLLSYLLLTGNILSAQRAFLMSLAGALLLFRARRTHPLRLLAAAAFLILLAEPLALFEPSFQLSFAGVLGILLLVPRWLPRLSALPRSLRWGTILLLTTLGATAATTPLVLLHFHLLAPAGILTNLLAVPLIGFLAMPTGLLGALLSPVWTEGGALLLQFCAFVIESVLRGVEWTISLPLLSGWKIYLTLMQVSGSILLCSLPFITGGFWRSWLARASLLTAGAVLLFWVPSPPSELTVTALSVGQGDAFLLTRPDGRQYLIDGGGLHSETFDVGERLLAPALGRLGVRELEAVVLTHDQNDHRQGLRHVLEQFPVKEFWSSEDPEKLHPSIAGAIASREVPTVRFPSGWSILEEDGQRTLALFVPAIETGNPNDRSLILYVRHGKDGVLLTGDLEAPGVTGLLAAARPGPVNLLKLPHHGSRRSSTHLLLDRFKPRMAFVSVGAGNPFHFPHAEVLADLEQRHIPLYRTDLLGSVRFLSQGNGWRVQHWQRGLFR